ncbi:hypothetical protein L207DRAFT_301129 [Hyaloscypha variabilis F]|uniref:Uncharacterized protein n=1 Tax=Hyaloscypha variabilis (strain UAMH 11265 / GT02V1 / F) TaxID=1149755 RepID=A0A2J6RYL5_HYAVF|nr:hypothetical protein L207DRAFT_301129 [Hyaloscypha variabilis F]
MQIPPNSFRNAYYVPSILLQFSFLFSLASASHVYRRWPPPSPKIPETLRHVTYPLSIDFRLPQLDRYVANLRRDTHCLCSNWLNISLAVSPERHSPTGKLAELVVVCVIRLPALLHSHDSQEKTRKAVRRTELLPVCIAQLQEHAVRQQLEETKTIVS